MDDKKSKIITGVLIAVIVIIIGVLAYFAYTVLKDKKTEDNYTQTANEYEKKVTSAASKSGSNVTLNSLDVDLSGIIDERMEGYRIIGTIEIPKVDLKCPILEEVTTRSIEIAVARMWPGDAELNQVGNVVIYGHNYRNKLFFSRNDELEIGDEVKILDSTGTKLTYDIYDIFETTMTDTTFYARDTQGKAEITLSTCTDDAGETDRRLIILAREKE